MEASTYALQKCQKLASHEWGSRHEWVFTEGEARGMNGFLELHSSRNIICFMFQFFKVGADSG